MNLIVHAGLYKTGTTALQNFLYNNSSLLAERGFLYPEIGQVKKAHYPISWGMHKGHPHFEKYRNRLGEYREAIIKTAHKKNCENILLSAETFCDIKELSPLLDWLNPRGIKLVIYLRRQDQLLQSLYAQRVVKSNKEMTDTFPTFLQNELGYWVDYHQKLVTDYVKAVGKNSIVFGVYENERFGRDLTLDFLSLIGIDKADNFIDVGVYNRSLPTELIEVMRICNDRLDMNRKERALFRESMVRLLEEGGTQVNLSRSLMAHEDIDRIRGSFADFNSTVAKDFLKRTDGRLFADKDWSVESTGDRSSWSEDAASAIAFLASIWLHHLRSTEREPGFLEGLRRTFKVSF
jgi:hypothetical protein